MSDRPLAVVGKIIETAEIEGADRILQAAELHAKALMSFTQMGPK